VRGYYEEGRRWLEEALDTGGRGSLESRTMALAGVGALALEQDDLDRAQEASEEGLELLLAQKATQRSEAKLYLLITSGHVALEREDYSRATELFEESLALSREIEHGLGLAASVMSLATVNHEQGDSQRATELYEESLYLFRKRGDKLGLAWCLINLGLVSYSRGTGRSAAGGAAVGRSAGLTRNRGHSQRHRLAR
jgi:tetratricopeptide (TPR) repeat protein